MGFESTASFGGLSGGERADGKLSVRDDVPMVVVLGMHRSGTSLCANILQAMGFDMAETPGASPNNARGHWERARINDLNDRVFNAFSRGWARSAHVLALPEHWLADPRVGAVRDELVGWLRPRMASGRFGFKDPRTARLLPMWRQVFAALGVTPRFVLCVRDPAQVARSISARDRLSSEESEYRWLIYNADAASGVGTDPVCIVPYEDWFVCPEQTASRLAAFVGGAPLAAPVLTALVDPALRHDSTSIVRAGALGQRLHEQILGALAGERFGADTLGLCDVLAECERSVQPLLVDVEVLRASVAEQNRVIGDLNGALRTVRHASG